jgi:hypothetical protein
MIIFDGSCDDLVHVSGQANYPTCDEVNVRTYDSHNYATFFYVRAGEWGDKMIVHAIYDGCWSFAPGKWSEDDNFPDWPITFKVNENGYSVDLYLDAPKDTWVKQEGMLLDYED